MKWLKAWCKWFFVALASLLWVLLSEKPYRRKKWWIAMIVLLFIVALYLVTQVA